MSWQLVIKLYASSSYWHHAMVTLYSSWLHWVWLIKEIAQDGKRLGNDCGPLAVDSLDNEHRDWRAPCKLLYN